MPSVLGRLLRSNPFNSPQVPMTAANLSYFLDLFGGGRTDSNEIVTPVTSLQVSTVFAVVRLISDQTGKTPCHVFSVDDSGKYVARDHPIYDLLSISPNEETSAIVWRQALTAQMLLWGNSYAEIQRNGAGQPMALWPRFAGKTRPMRRLDGSLVYETTDNPSGALRYVEPGNMVHVPYVSLDGMTGLSPVAHARQLMGSALALDKYGARYFSNGATPKVAIKFPSPMKPEDKTKARNDWEALQSGSNQHRVAILDGGASLETLTIPNNDAQFLESRKFTAEAICGLYGCPPHLIGLVDKTTKATVEQQGQEFAQFTLGPILTRFKQEFQRKLLPSTGRSANRYLVQFDTKDLLRPDAASRQSFYQSGIQNGYLNPDEVRAEEGLNPLPNGEGRRNMVQVTMQPLANLGNPTPPGTVPTGMAPPAKTPTVADPVALDDEEQENSLHSRLTGAYSPLFRDALSRFLHRSKRDSSDLEACLGPVVLSLHTALGTDGANGTEAYLRQAAQRSKEWTTEALNEIVANELKAVIHCQQ